MAFIVDFCSVHIMVTYICINKVHITVTLLYVFIFAVFVSSFDFRLFNLRKKISKREICQNLIPKDYPVYIDKVMYCLSSTFRFKTVVCWGHV